MLCSQEGCTGHLGKFQSCRDEAIWQQTLDGGDRETGSVDYDGHYTLMIYDRPDTVVIDDGSNRSVEVPAGNYVVHNTPSGAVYVYDYKTATAARRDMDKFERLYLQWEDS